VSALRAAVGLCARPCPVQLHNSLGDGKPPQAGIEDELAPAPPDADAVADPEPLPDPLPPPVPEPPPDPDPPADP
jgi:hypothetical protein